MKVVSVWSLSKAKNLQTLHIPNGVEVHRALAKAPKLKKITVSKSNKKYSVKNNALLNKKGTVLMGYPGGYSTLRMLDSVTRIEELYFSQFKQIKPGKNLKKIGFSALSDNNRLKTLRLDKKVQVLEGHAFSACKNLKKVVLGKNVKRIEFGAFALCDNLKVIYIYNKNCKIDTNKYYADRAIPDGATVYGWKGSTAQKYAKKFKLTFKALKK